MNTAGDLWKQFHDEPTIELRNELVCLYLPIVQHCATRLAAGFTSNIENDDLFSAGVFGLIDAIKSFDSARGTKFETYCFARVYGSMLDEIRRLDWVPRLRRGRAVKIARSRREYRTQNGSDPSDSELAEFMGLSEEELFDAAIRTVASLSHKWFETDSKEVRTIDLLKDRTAEDPSDRMERLDLLRELTKGLNRTERLIIIGYYYLDHTMHEVARQLGISESRVSQIHTAILQSMRNRVEAVAA